MNSIDLYFSTFWDVVINRSRNVLYGPTFYLKFLHKVNHEALWSNRTRLNRFFDDWYHATLFMPFQSYGFMKQIIKYIYINEIVPLKVSFNYYYYKYVLMYHIIDFLEKILDIHKSIFYYPTIYEYFNIFDLSIMTSHEEKFDLVRENFRKYLFFLSGYYSWTYIFMLFSYNFITNYSDFFLLKGLATIPVFGRSSAFLNLNYLRHLRYYRYHRLSYFSNMFELLRKDLWGNSKPSSSSFFMFYSRQWFTSEKQYFYARILHRQENARIRINSGTRDPVYHKFDNYGLFFFTDYYDHLLHQAEVRDMPEVYTQALPYKRATIAHKKLRVGARYYWHYQSANFYTKYLLPDIGFIGSSTWGTKWKYMSFDTSVKYDSLYFKTGRRPFRRHF